MGGPERAVRVISVVSGPFILLVFAVIYASRRDLYDRLLREDGVAENLTVVFFLVAIVFAARALRLLQGQSWRRRWFYVCFIAVCVVGAVEEISWGQRIFGWEAPDYFKTHSRQQETNVHNVLEYYSGVKVKEVALGTLLVYGVILPLVLHRYPATRAWIERTGFRVPGPALSASFLVGTLLAYDWPTRREEEIAEMVYALCLCLFMITEGQGLDRRPRVHDGFP